MKIQSIEIDCNPTDSIKQLKEKIPYAKGTSPFKLYKLFYGVKELKSKKLLSDYKIQSGSIIDLEIQDNSSKFLNLEDNL